MFFFLFFFVCVLLENMMEQLLPCFAQDDVCSLILWPCYKVFPGSLCFSPGVLK